MECNDFRELIIRYSFYFDQFPLICLCVFFVYDRVHVEVTFISNTATFQANSSIKTNVLHAFVKVIYRYLVYLFDVEKNSWYW